MTNPIRRSVSPLARLALLALLPALSVPAHAAEIRVLASDAKGVTLRLTLGAWGLGAPGRDGRVLITGVEGSHVIAVPGRPMLPAWSATLAVPEGSRPSARVIGSEGELARSDVRVATAGQPVFRPGGDGGLGDQPALDPVAPIADGVWPGAMVETTRPYPFRGRRLLSLELRPFRADESAARVSAPLSLTVRVDFNVAAAFAARPPGGGGPDPHVDASLAAAVLNWDQARDWRQPAARLEDARTSLFAVRGARPGAALAFDETQPEVRVKLGETALWRLSFDELAAKGYPAGVSTGEVSVHRHEFLEGAVPPYGTIELPSEVEDANGNGVFDSGDGVWVYVRTWAERSGATVVRRFWGDAEVVFVTRKPGGALRLPQRPGWNNVAGLTPLVSFPFKRHYEKAFAPIMQFVESTADTNIDVWQWTSNAFYYTRPDTIRFDATGVDTTQPVGLSVRWVGRNRDNHFMSAAIRNSLNLVSPFADSVFWFGKTALVVDRTLPGRALTDGNTNFLRMWGKSGFGPPDPVTNSLCIAGLDWFDVTYGRFYRASGDYLRFNSGAATGDVQMQISGFSGDSVRVWDVTDPDAPVRVVVDRAHVTTGPGGLSVEFQDVAAPPTRREYVAATFLVPDDPTVGPRIPPTGAYSAVTRRDLWNNLSGDYLVVVPEAFEPATVSLEALRARQGLTVLHAPVESVYDEFDGGRHSGTAIQRFVKYAYARWTSRFLLLVGDGTLDPQHVRALSGPDWIPILPSLGPVGTSEGLEVIPSDNRYAFITGNDDPIVNPAPDPVVPELMVGRLTVNSLGEADAVMQKIVAYENIVQPDDWRRNVLLLADDPFSGETTFGGGTTTSGYCHRGYEELFVDIDQRIRAAILSDTGVAGMNVEQFDLRAYLPGEDTTFDSISGEACRVDRSITQSHTHNRVTPILIGKLTSGQLWWNYQGHANEYVLTHEDLYVNSGVGQSDDAQRLGNLGKPFFFSAFSCHANMFARPDVQLSTSIGPSIGEDLLALPNRGAVASWASVCYEVVPRPVDHVNISLARMMFVHTPHDEFLGADDRGARVVLGEVLLATLLDYLPTTIGYAPERGLGVSYTLLGDPATRMSIGRPQSAILANELPAPLDTPLRLHTPGDTLRLDATFVSTARLDSVALFRNTGSGDVMVPATDYTLTPAFPDTAASSTSGGRRFRLIYRTQPEARSTAYVFVVRDRDGLVRRSTVMLSLDALLRSGGTPINDRDEVPPNATLSLLVLSPKPLADPQAEITLRLNGQPVSFTHTPSPNDASGREWILSWSHADYPVDDYALVMAIQGGGSVTRLFRVTASASRLAFRDLFPFPNPFGSDGTRFSFMLLGGENADVKIHVFTQSGRSIYTGTLRDLTPGYHQLAWDGRDAEGDEIANGLYFFRLVAKSASGASTQQLGRLVKLRRPRHVEEPVIP